MHQSVRMETPCEIINVVPCNPLISKCQIKVCYVGDKPNRNRSVITKDVAREMANSLPGSPIVGYYNEAKEDFEEHNRSIDIVNGEFRIKDTTRPYGFVDLGAKCWFQKFKDDGVNEHEYLMTEGYIWTGQYPESRRIIEKGNNHSMELDDKMLDATWTKDNNGKPQFFIINEAIVSKLCILGEECEPCFEGSQITKVQFSFEEGFKEQLFSMINEVKELLNKGGTQVFTTYAVKVGDSLWSALYSYSQENNYKIEAVLEDGEQKFAVLKDAEDKIFRLDFSVEEDTISLGETVVEMEDYVPAEEPQFALEEVEAFESEFKKNGSEDDKKKEEEEKEEKPSKEDDSEKEDNSEEKDSEDKSAESKDEDKNDEDKKKKNKYNLEEIPEYIELSSKFSDLETRYNNLVAEKESLESQLQPLVEFKNNAERVQKENMINNTFYMLSDEDKKEVIDNIDTYSLDDIEAKLSIICVRNKVSFAALEEEDDLDSPITYNLGSDSFENEPIPGWIKAVLETAKTL